MTARHPGQAHRARLLDDVEREQREARKSWGPHACSTACHTGVCDCTPAPAPGFDAPEFLADPPRPAPPAYPWRGLGAMFLTLFAVLGAVHALGAFDAPASQVAAR